MPEGVDAPYWGLCFYDQNKADELSQNAPAALCRWQGHGVRDGHQKVVEDAELQSSAGPKCFLEDTSGICMQPESSRRLMHGAQTLPFCFLEITWIPTSMYRVFLVLSRCASWHLFCTSACVATKVLTLKAPKQGPHPSMPGVPAGNWRASRRKVRAPSLWPEIRADIHGRCVGTRCEFTLS